MNTIIINPTLLRAMRKTRGPAASRNIIIGSKGCGDFKIGGCEHEKLAPMNSLGHIEGDNKNKRGTPPRDILVGSSNKANGYALFCTFFVMAARLSDKYEPMKRLRHVSQTVGG